MWQYRKSTESLPDQAGAREARARRVLQPLWGQIDERRVEAKDDADARRASTAPAKRTRRQRRRDSPAVQTQVMMPAEGGRARSAAVRETKRARERRLLATAGAADEPAKKTPTISLDEAVASALEIVTAVRASGSSKKTQATAGCVARALPPKPPPRPPPRPTAAAANNAEQPTVAPVVRMEKREKRRQRRPSSMPSPRHPWRSASSNRGSSSRGAAEQRASSQRPATAQHRPQQSSEKKRAVDTTRRGRPSSAAAAVRGATEPPGDDGRVVFATAGGGSGVSAVVRGWSDHDPSQPASAAAAGSGSSSSSSGSRSSWRHNTDVGSIARGEWDVLWSARPVSADEITKLRSDQLVNSFPSMADITTKSSLPRQLHRLGWQQDVDCSRFFPRSYDMALSQSERLDFTNDFVLTLAMAVLRTFIDVQNVIQCDGSGPRSICAELQHETESNAGAGAVLKACWVWESSLACTAGRAGIFAPRSSLTEQEIADMHTYLDGHLHLDGPSASRQRSSSGAATSLVSSGGAPLPSRQLVEDLLARVDQQQQQGQAGGSTAACSWQRSSIDGRRGIWVLKPAVTTHTQSVVGCAC